MNFMAYIKKVLLPEGSSRQVLPMARYLTKAGCEVTTVQEKKTDLGSVTRFAANKIIIPGVDTDLDVAVPFYRALCQKHTYDLIIPLSDFSAKIFANEKASIERNGNTKIAVNELNVFLQASDKLNTMLACMKNNIPCPWTLEKVSSINDVPKDMKYPVIIKPRSSCGSIGLHLARNRKELKGYIEQIHNEGLGGVLVQEFIPQTGKQYNAQFLLDPKHEVKMAVLAEKCRWFPVDGGASTLCRTIHNDKIMKVCESLLKTIDWIGYCDIDLMEDPRDGIVKIIEINPRISANIKLCYSAGADIAKQLLQLYSGKEVTGFSAYKDDVRLRCIHTDLLWFLKSSDRFRTDPSWFSIKHTHDQIGAWDDIKPFIYFSLEAPLKYRREMKKRKR